MREMRHVCVISAVTISVASERVCVEKREREEEEEREFEYELRGKDSAVINRS